ncbi:hypothetical protein [Streptomyces sp. NY05-11A]|uniref:hypothetical protein n=1 Tax=Streptomyces soliscabiei TaxID=588897 RepID=UPI003B994015
MSGSDGPAWAGEERDGLCRLLRNQLVETINVIRSQAAAVPPAPGLEPTDERPVQVPRRHGGSRGKSHRGGDPVGVRTTRR